MPTVSFQHKLPNFRIDPVHRLEGLWPNGGNDLYNKEDPWIKHASTHAPAAKLGALPAKDMAQPIFPTEMW